MNSKSKTLIVIIAILLISNISMLVFFLGGREQRKPAERKHPFMTELLQKEVGFNQTQLNNFESLQKQHRDKMRPMFEEMRNSKLRLYKQIGQSGVSDTVLDSAAAVVGERQRAIDLQIARHFTQIRGLCTPAQLPAFDSLVAKVTKKMISMPFGRGKGDSAARRN